MSLKYLIVGAGGVGGSVAAFLGMARRDVTLIARGGHLRAMKEKGMAFIQGGEEKTVPGVKPMSAEEYEAEGEVPDVIFLCTKSYSVKDVAPFLRQVAGKDTLVISLLNGVGVAEQVQEEIPEVKVIPGLIYIFARKDGDGRIFLSGNRMHVFFGSEDLAVSQKRLAQIAEECNVPGMQVTLSEEIQTEILRKFSLVGAMAVTALVYHCPMGPIMKTGEERDFFVAAVEEIMALGESLGIPVDSDLLERNLSVLDHSKPEDTTSLQRDVAAGGPCETDTFLLLPIRLGAAKGLEMPCWRRAAGALNLHPEQ